jgi:hypothetical protein
MRLFALAGVLACAGCGEVVMPLPEGTCEVSRSREFFSPGGTKKAVIFDRRCGSGSAERNVSVLSAEEPLDNMAGNALSERIDPQARERLAYIELAWKGEDQLTISRNPSMAVSKVPDSASGVEIIHLIQDSDEAANKSLERTRGE